MKGKETSYIIVFIQAHFFLFYKYPFPCRPFQGLLVWQKSSFPKQHLSSSNFKSMSLRSLSRNTLFGVYLILPFYYSFPLWMFCPLWYHHYSSTDISFISVSFFFLSIFLKYQQSTLFSQDTSFWYPSKSAETLYNSTCTSYLGFLYPSQETRKAMGFLFKCSLCCKTKYFFSSEKEGSVPTLNS